VEVSQACLALMPICGVLMIPATNVILLKVVLTVLVFANVVIVRHALTELNVTISLTSAFQFLVMRLTRAHPAKNVDMRRDIASVLHALNSNVLIVTHPNAMTELRHFPIPSAALSHAHKVIIVKPNQLIDGLLVAPITSLMVVEVMDKCVAE